MRFRSMSRASKGKIETLRRSYSQLQPQQGRPSSFAIALDIDGVILQGHTPIGGSPHALQKLYNDNGSLKIPFVFLTNGGGVPESKRATELTGLLGVQISPLQVVQGHSPFRELVSRFKNELILAVGKGEPAAVMSEYGYRKVLSIDEYASYFNDIDPLSQYKNWGIRQAYNKAALHSRFNIYSDRVKGVFVVSDPVDWGRDIQVLSDILSCGGLPGKGRDEQPPLYFAADDLQYQAAFPSERLGMGAFRIALESIYNRIHSSPLQYTSFGKPNPFVFKNAEAILAQLVSNGYCDRETTNGVNGHLFSTIYMIGDNPSVDIKGAIKASHPWFSILTRTGVFKGANNHPQFPADLVVDTVEQAIDYILNKEQVVENLQSQSTMEMNFDQVAGRQEHDNLLEKLNDACTSNDLLSSGQRCSKTNGMPNSIHVLSQEVESRRDQYAQT